MGLCGGIRLAEPLAFHLAGEGEGKENAESLQLRRGHLMALTGWLGKSLRGRAAARSVQTRRNRRPRLQVERLEDRWVPSYFLTNLDSFNGVNGRAPNAL